MQLAERIHLVGSGSFGFDLTDSYDCHIYLLDGGSELGLIDVGAGMGVSQTISNIRRAGFDPALVRHILCTHAHGDHAGGAAQMRALLPNAELAISRDVARFVRAGDEVATSVAAAKTIGVYPRDYRLEPCAVERELADGERIAIGDLTVECIETPGHAVGHLSFLLDQPAAASSSEVTPYSTAAPSSSRTSTTAASRRRLHHSERCECSQSTLCFPVTSPSRSDTDSGTSRKRTRRWINC